MFYDNIHIVMCYYYIISCRLEHIRLLKSEISDGRFWLQTLVSRVSVIHTSHSCVSDPHSTTSNEETFLQIVLVILKYLLQNYQKIMFPLYYIYSDKLSMFTFPTTLQYVIR